ncbi:MULTISPECIES: DUF4097 family beta strand repeat-containing protein [Nocardiopsis]|uniref:DUF4097 domain-containing protein n=1 Tax=Nocardiopsis sinuspersici TaxID=501010 RepID=A0A1V3C384_9ACTN|nr:MULTISPECIES: DUF4097 family beta strand repeat-containing protein [Nocardiopsis]NYH51643.1 hypothetical protein [Nocardiopsis sinuspersici]OOC55257.1 hypothetical protein NOSIN_16745 [Nocardiopsis sinuspersici]
MARWTIDRPMTQTLDGIVALRVRIIGGHVNILPTDDPVTFEVTDIVGEPLLVTQEAGILTIHYEDLTSQGLLDRLRPVQLSGYKRVQHRKATVNLRLPKDCPVEVSTATASIVAAGLSARSHLRTASGEITIDDTAGETEIGTVSGSTAVRNPHGALKFNSVSGQLAVAGGRLSALKAKTVSGQLLADTDIAPAGRVRLNSISGEIALRVPSETSAAVELRTAKAPVESDFGLDRRSAPGRTVLNGKIGSGVDPASITINSASGRTALLRRAPEAPAAIPEGA